LRRWHRKLGAHEKAREFGAEMERLSVITWVRLRPAAAALPALRKGIAKNR
jgi:hypothetical protein